MYRLSIASPQRGGLVCIHEKRVLPRGCRSFGDAKRVISVLHKNFCEQEVEQRRHRDDGRRRRHTQRQRTSEQRQHPRSHVHRLRREQQLRSPTSRLGRHADNASLRSSAQLLVHDTDEGHPVRTIGCRLNCGPSIQLPSGGESKPCLLPLSDLVRLVLSVQD